MRDIREIGTILGLTRFYPYYKNKQEITRTYLRVALNDKYIEERDCTPTTELLIYETKKGEYVNYKGKRYYIKEVNNE